MPPLGAAGFAFGVFLFPDEFAGAGVIGLGSAGADEDFAIGDEWGGGGAFAGKRGFPDFFAGGGVDAVEVGAGDGVDTVVDDSGGAGRIAADRKAFAFVAPHFFSGGEVETDDDVVGDFDGVGDDGEEFVFEFGENCSSSIHWRKAAGVGKGLPWRAAILSSSARGKAVRPALNREATQEPSAMRSFSVMLSWIHCSM